jgi:uncharacterized membrane protein YjgN (DUF898 family)
MITRTMDNNNHSQKTTTTSITVIAIIAALAVLGVVVITVTVIIPQQAEARGCPTGTPGINASKGRCFHP